MKKNKINDDYYTWQSSSMERKLCLILRDNDLFEGGRYDCWSLVQLKGSGQNNY